MSGVRFDVQVGNKVYPVTTDQTGVFSLQFAEPVGARITELTRPMGGLWALTTPLQAVYQVQDCETKHVWVGNAPVKPPKTGRALPIHSAAGSYDCM